MRRSPWLGAALGAFAALFALITPRDAAAYPWMIEHQYTSCAECHIDPSGGSAMTEYGRAQADTIVRMHYGEVGTPGKGKDFLFGVVPLPEEVLAQADVRGMFFPMPSDGDIILRTILMQADLRLGLQTKLFKAYGSLGVVDEGALGARLLKVDATATPVVAPVARDYWVGVTPTKGMTIRAGRINLPFGLRTENHITYTRAITRTTLNDDQQMGLAAAFQGKGYRGEVMGLAGNFHVSPDDFRERGYSGFFTLVPDGKLELGVSSLFATSQVDVETLLPRARQAHGVFSRWAPVEKLGVFFEADVLLDKAGPDAEGTAGFVGELAADWEAKGGLHVRAGGEVCENAFSDDQAANLRGSTAVQWFFLPHADLRVDALMGPIACTPGAESRPAALAQLHFFL